jgi:hypothetical protein
MIGPSWLIHSNPDVRVPPLSFYIDLGNVLYFVYKAVLCALLLCFWMPNNKQRSEIVTSDGRTDEDVAGQARTIDVSERIPSNSSPNQQHHQNNNNNKFIKQQ